MTSAACVSFWRLAAAPTAAAKMNRHAKNKWEDLFSFAVHYQIWSEYRLSQLVFFIRPLLFVALLCLTNQFLRGNYRA